MANHPAWIRKLARDLDPTETLVPGFYTVGQLCIQLAVHPDGLKQAREVGGGPAYVTRRGRVLYPKKACNKWMASVEIEPGGVITDGIARIPIL